MTWQGEAELAGRFLPGELIQWSGQPGLGILFEPRDILLVPFSLIWGGFAIFWETMALTRARAPLSLQLWGVPFVLAVLFIIFGRFLLDAHIRARLIYAIAASTGNGIATKSCFPKPAAAACILPIRPTHYGPGAAPAISAPGITASTH
jgi:hypothetical protein